MVTTLLLHSLKLKKKIKIHDMMKENCTFMYLSYVIFSNSRHYLYFLSFIYSNYFLHLNLSRYHISQQNSTKTSCGCHVIKCFESKFG